MYSMFRRVMYNHKYLFVKGFVIGSVVFGIIGWIIPIASPLSTEQFQGGVLRTSAADYKYIDPLLSCEIGSEATFPELNPIKDSVAKVVKDQIQWGEAQDISVYFRRLNTAEWFELNGSTTYAPASLLKVFVMMAYYKAANEMDYPGLLQKQIAFEGSKDPSKDMPGEIIPHLVSGRFYTVAQLIDQMIIYSDNDALTTLANHFDSQTLNYFNLIFKDLGIPNPDSQNENSLNFMNVKDYSLVFRVLYGSTYLSERYSEHALDLLSRVHFKGGIVMGVPSSLAVAHKFGIKSIPETATSAGAAEFHDCGIVYYPNDPYFLCVMTRGSNFVSLQTAVQAASAAVYNGYRANLR